MSELESLQRRFEVLSETLQIRQEQFDQAMAMLESEREAHAAEVAELRNKLSAAHESFEEIHCGNAQCESKYGGCNQSCKREAYAASQRIEAALAAPPTAAAQAIEGMRRALEDSLSRLYAIRISERHEPAIATSARYSFTNSADAAEVEAAIDMMSSALAAWKEATRG